jgi:thiol-disulfide isomerase/thioredoxin
MQTRLRLNAPLPDLRGATDWINGPPDYVALAGRPVLVYFWSASCQLCHETLPTIATWREQYSPHGVQFIAIHVPRQEADMQLSRVRALAGEHDIVDPCGVDNQHAVKTAFASDYVPAFFFFDALGKLRGRAGGSHGLVLLEHTLKRYITMGTRSSGGYEHLNADYRHFNHVLGTW